MGRLADNKLRQVRTFTSENASKQCQYRSALGCRSIRIIHGIAENKGNPEDEKEGGDDSVGCFVILVCMHCFSPFDYYFFDFVNQPALYPEAFPLP